MEDKIEIFICYAHKDEALMRELEKQLGTLVHRDLIKIWHDRKIIGGADWKQEVNKHLNSAHIILLLVSADFMASEYSHVEVNRAMERYKAGETQVIPVILRPVSWRSSSFGHLKPLPKDGKAVISSVWHYRDEALLDVVEGIEKAIEELKTKVENVKAQSGESVLSPVKEASMSTKPAIQGKKEFDVFLCHNSKDKPEVKKIAEKLKEQGVVPWLDVWELRPGLPWQRALEEQIEHIKSAAVFVGSNGRGPWQDMELEAFLREFVSRGCPVIPVVLADAPDKPSLPPFLRGMTWVDFRKPIPDPMEQLIWGITGTNPHEGGAAGGSSQNVPSSSQNMKSGPSLSQIKREELQERYKRLSEKIAYFEKEFDDTTNAAVRFELSKQIGKERAERYEVEAELHKLDLGQ